MVENWAGRLRRLTFELTGPLRRDGLARAAKMYRVPQPGPRQPAVAGPVVERGVRPRPQNCWPGLLATVREGPLATATLRGRRRAWR